MEEEIQKKFKELSGSITNIRIASDKIIKKVSALERNHARVDNQFQDIRSLNFEGIWPKLTKLARRITVLEAHDDNCTHTLAIIEDNLKRIDKEFKQCVHKEEHD